MIDQSIYDQVYFDRYRRQGEIGIGPALNDFRTALAAKYAGPSGGILDVGIGSGTFLDRLGPDRPRWGYDVNPAGIAWLRERGLWHDPYGGLPTCCRVVTLHDVMEHLEWPGELLGRFPDGTHVVVSIPIYESLDDVHRSKHLRTTEHRWHFTAPGLIGYLGELGYAVVETSDMETRLGRESILTVAARKGEKPRVSLGHR